MLGPQHDDVEHRRPLPHREVPAALERVRAAAPTKVATLEFEFLVLTAARGGEIRGVVWSEIDHDAGVWTIPANRMKAGREHQVPLCGRAVEILDTARTLGGSGSPIVFVTERGKSLDEKHKIEAVPHGFRSSFRDWAAKETDHPREVIEVALIREKHSKAEVQVQNRHSDSRQLSMRNKRRTPLLTSETGLVVS